MAMAYRSAMYPAVKDPDALAACARLSGPAIVTAGGRILVRGMPAVTCDAGIAERTVAMAFDTVEAAVAAPVSPADQAALALLGDAVLRDIRIVEGVR